MKVLHITNELSKKNYSIASIIFFLTDKLYDQKKNISILASKIDQNLFYSKLESYNNLQLIKIFSWLNIFLYYNDLKKIIISNDIIHVHGIWSPIQFFSIILSVNSNKKIIIHPHGMLLDEAVKSDNRIKFLLKIFALFILKRIIDSNIFFVSITNQETLAINKYFPKSKIKQISNPIPFENNVFDLNKKEKKFVYFGRIHPHKNLLLLIDSFIAANLSEDWSLEIYGIEDDENYLRLIENKIKHYKNISIMSPIFGYEKQKIMYSSWANILISKSEVLSLSILESSLYGLPTLVNKEIEIKNFGESIIPTDLNIENIKENIIEISRWKLEERINKEKKIIEIIKDKTSFEKISNEYISLYSQINNSVEDFSNQYLETANTKSRSEITFLSFKKNFNFLLMSTTYMFNLMFASILIVTLVIIGKYSIAGELGLITSFWLTITQIFSSNMRSIIVSDNNEFYAHQTLFYRIAFTTVSLIIFYYISISFFNFENINLIFAISALVMFQWINEMNLVQEEIKNKINLFKFFLIINFFLIIISAVLLYLEHLNSLVYLFYGYIFVLIISILRSLIKIKFKKFDIEQIIKINLKNIAFLSSFSLIISSFAWRIIIYLIFEKPLAGIFFACFSVGSFPGTLFNSVIGPAYVRQNIILSRTIKNIIYSTFIIITIAAISSAYMLIIEENKNFLGFNFIIFTALISLIGSYFMSYAMYLRHKKIQISAQERFYLFKRDIVYGISIIFLIPLLFKFGGTYAVSFTFLIAATIAIFTYSINFKKRVY